jgi:hypothetical protein
MLDDLRRATAGLGSAEDAAADADSIGDGGLRAALHAPALCCLVLLPSLVADTAPAFLTVDLSSYGGGEETPLLSAQFRGHRDGSASIDQGASNRLKRDLTKRS